MTFAENITTSLEFAAYVQIEMQTDICQNALQYAERNKINSAKCTQQKSNISDEFIEVVQQKQENS